MINKIGTSSKQLRKLLTKSHSQKHLPPERISLKVVNGDELKNNFKLKLLPLSIKFEELNRNQLPQILQKYGFDCETWFPFDINGQQLKAFDPHHAVVIVFQGKSIQWIRKPIYNEYVKQLQQLDQPIQRVLMRSPQIMNKMVNNLELQQVPLTSVRQRPLQQTSVHLEKISAILNQRTNTDPFIMTNLRLRTTMHTQSNIQQTRGQQQNSRFILNKEEQQYLNKISECENELQEYLDTMHSQLSNYESKQDDILEYYKQIMQANPIFQGIQNNYKLTSNIGTQLQQILSNRQHSVSSLKSNVNSSHTKHRLLTDLNIPKLNNQYNMSRQQLYQFHSLYKVLQLLSAQLSNTPQPQGINYYTYRNGIEQIQDQTSNIAEGIFRIIDSKFTGFLDWKQYLYLMSQVQAKTKDERIDLFIKIADSDTNRQLSYNEVINLCQQTLIKFITTKDKQFMDDMSDFFTRMIFDSVQVPYDKEIEFQRLKEVIKSNHQDADLLCMFCGVDI